jgi:hypothetical protein
VEERQRIRQQTRKTAKQFYAYSVGCLLPFPKADLPMRGFLSFGATDAARRHLTQQTKSYGSALSE